MIRLIIQLSFPWRSNEYNVNFLRLHDHLIKFTISCNNVRAIIIRFSATCLCLNSKIGVDKQCYHRLIVVSCKTHQALMGLSRVGGTFVSSRVIEEERRVGID